MQSRLLGWAVLAVFLGLSLTTVATMAFAIDPGTVLTTADHVAKQDDRYLFIAVLVLLMVFAGMVIRWLVTQLDKVNTKLVTNLENSNVALTKALENNTAALQDFVERVEKSAEREE